MNDTNKSDKRRGRFGEWGKLRKRTGRRRAANKRSRAAAKREISK